MAKYTREEHEKYRAEQDRKAKKAQQEQDERREKIQVRAAWLSDGGNPDTFEAEWPSLRRELHSSRIQKADERLDRARQEQRASGLSSI